MTPIDFFVIPSGVPLPPESLVTVAAILLRMRENADNIVTSDFLRAAADVLRGTDTSPESELMGRIFPDFWLQCASGLCCLLENSGLIEVNRNWAGDEECDFVDLTFKGEMFLAHV